MSLDPVNLQLQLSNPNVIARAGFWLRRQARYELRSHSHLSAPCSKNKSSAKPKAMASSPCSAGSSKDAAN